MSEKSKGWTSGQWEQFNKPPAKFDRELRPLHVRAVELSAARKEQLLGDFGLARKVHEAVLATGGKLRNKDYDTIAERLGLDDPAEVYYLAGMALAYEQKLKDDAVEKKGKQALN